MGDRTINAALEKLAGEAPDCAVVGHPAPPRPPKLLVVNSFYFESLRVRGMSSISQWTEQLDHSQVEKIVFPVFASNHWSMGVLFPAARVCLLLDSLRPLHHAMSAVLLTHSDIDVVIYSKGVAQQPNGDDCGVYALYFAQCALQNQLQQVYAPVPEKFVQQVRDFEVAN